MTGVLTPNPDEILDFSPPAEDQRPKWFRVGPDDDDVFCAAARIPVLISGAFIRGIRQLQEADPAEGAEETALDRVLELFRQVLWPEDVERFVARCADIRRPIDHRDLMRVMQGLMERWGMRPTTPSGVSSDGQPPPDDGTNSEAAPSPPPASTSPTPALTSSATSSTPASSPG